jgi:hypothetical protein
MIRERREERERRTGGVREGRWLMVVKEERESLKVANGFLLKFQLDASSSHRRALFSFF